VAGPNDPLYDSDEEPAGIFYTKVEIEVDQLAAFKETCIRALREYLSSEDVSEVMTVLHEEAEVEWLYEFVKQALTIALEASDRERELVSECFVALALPTAQLAQGFVNTFLRIDDLSLDTPDAVTVLSAFIVRAVTDDLLPPAFVHYHLRGEAHESKKAHELVDRCERLLETKNVGTHMENCFHRDVHRNLNKLKQSLLAICKEYLVTNEIKEATDSLVALQVTPFHFHFIKVAVYATLEASSEVESTAQTRMSALLQSLFGASIISQQAILSGLKIVQHARADLATDLGPATLGYLDQFIARGKDDGWIPKTAE